MFIRRLPFCARIAGAWIVSATPSFAHEESPPVRPPSPVGRVLMVGNPLVDTSSIDRENDVAEWYYTFDYDPGTGETKPGKVHIGTNRPQGSRKVEDHEFVEQTENIERWTADPAFPEFKKRPLESTIRAVCREKIEKLPRYQFRPKSAVPGAELQIPKAGLRTGGFALQRVGERACVVRIIAAQDARGFWTRNNDPELVLGSNQQKRVTFPADSAVHGFWYMIATPGGYTSAQWAEATAGTTIVKITDDQLPPLTCYRDVVGGDDPAKQRSVYRYTSSSMAQVLVVRVRNEDHRGDLTCEVSSATGQVLATSHEAGVADDLCVLSFGDRRELDVAVTAAPADVPVRFTCEFRSVPLYPTAADCVGEQVAVELGIQFLSALAAKLTDGDYDAREGVFSVASTAVNATGSAFAASTLMAFLVGTGATDWSRESPDRLLARFEKWGEFLPEQLAAARCFFERFLARLQSQITDPRAWLPELDRTAPQPRRPGK